MSRVIDEDVVAVEARVGVAEHFKLMLAEAGIDVDLVAGGPDNTILRVIPPEAARQTVSDLAVAVAALAECGFRALVVEGVEGDGIRIPIPQTGRR